jgi:hypothetical protein
MYGITPKAKIEALENDPPANIFKRPNKPSFSWLSNDAGFTPGNTINEPIRYIKRHKSVNKILALKSSIFQILDSVVNSFFMLTI